MHSFGNLLFRVRSCRLQVLEGAYSDTKHSSHRFSCNLVKMAIRGVYGFTVASVCFDTGNSMQMIKEQTDRCRICAYRIEVSRTMDAERLK